MKFVLGSFAMMTALAGGAAHAQTMTDDEQWACEVALCLSNPEGPTAAAECKAPIEKMHRELAKGHSIPKCKFIDDSDPEDGGRPVGGGGDKNPRPSQQLQ